MKAALLIFLGGGLGSVLRYLVGQLGTSLNLHTTWGTFTVNILGALIIGLLVGWSERSGFLAEHHLWLWAIGFCGGFTTFSTFALENQQLLKNGEFLHFAAYILGSLIVGILAVLLGFWLSRLGIES